MSNQWILKNVLCEYNKIQNELQQCAEDENRVGVQLKNKVSDLQRSQLALYKFGLERKKLLGTIRQKWQTLKNVESEIVNRSLEKDLLEKDLDTCSLKLEDLLQKNVQIEESLEISKEWVPTLGKRLREIGELKTSLDERLRVLKKMKVNLKDVVDHVSTTQSTSVDTVDNKSHLVDDSTISSDILCGTCCESRKNKLHVACGFLVSCENCILNISNMENPKCPRCILPVEKKDFDSHFVTIKF